MERGSGHAEGADARAEEEALDRLLRGLSHPLRRRIMASLAARDGSAKTLSAELGTRLPNISYHLNKVLAEECELVELVGRVPLRGAQEKVYRLNRRAVASGLATIRRPSFSSSFACSASFRPAAPG